MFKLKTIIVISYVVITGVFIAAFSLTTYKIFFDYTTEEISEARLTGVNESMSKVSSFTKSVKDSGVFFVTNREAVQPFYTDYHSEYDAIVEQRRLTELMDDIKSVQRIVHSIELYTDRYDDIIHVADSKVFSTEKIQGEPWFDLIENRDRGWIPEHQPAHANVELVSYFHHLPNQRGETVGYIKINILADTFFEGMYDDNFSDNIDEPLVLIGPGRQIMGKKNTQDVPDFIDDLIYYEAASPYGKLQEEYSGLFNYYDMIDVGSKKYTLVISKPNDDGWRLINLVPADSLYSETRRLGLFVMGLAVMCLVLLVPAAFWVGKSLLKPVRRLIHGMQEVEKGNFDARVIPHYIDEYKAMAMNFNRMAYQLDKSVKDLDKENRAKREAEIRTLQNQIVPHFLYNTLDMIHWRAMDYQAEDISYMVSQLSRMYRVGLNNGQSFMPLRDELEHVKCYINLQRARLKADIQYDVKVPARLKSVYVPRIILQPFVENSIKHGYPQNLQNEITICISARNKEEHLEIDISDNGKGLPEGWTLEDVTGIGVKNIKERIQLYCGKGYGVELFEENGTIVRLKLPLIQNKEGLNHLF